MKFNGNIEEDGSLGPEDNSSKHSTINNNNIQQPNQKVDKELQDAVINSKPNDQNQQVNTAESTTRKEYVELETQKLRVELQMQQVQINKFKINLSEQNELLKYQESQYANQTRELINLKGQMQELQDQNQLLQQSKKDHSQLPSFLSRAQDNSRKEILNLKQQIGQKDLSIQRLTRELDQESNKDLINQTAFQQQIEILSAQLEKQKLLSASLKKQSAENQAYLVEQQQKMKQNYEAEYKDLLSKLHQMEQYVQQIVKEYADKEAELQAIIKDKQSQSIQMAEIQRVANIAQEEVIQFKQRCKQLETDLEIKGKAGNGLEQKQIRDMEFEINQVRDQHQKQLAAVKEDNRKLNIQLQQAQSQVKALEAGASAEEKLIQMGQQLIDCESVISQVGMLVRSNYQPDLSNAQLLLEDVQQIVESAEEANILKQEYQSLKERSQENESQLQDAEDQVQKLRRELQLLQRQQNQNPSNFTKTLLMEKDKEIQLLKSDFGQEKKKVVDLEDQLWHAQRELEALQIKVNEGERVLKEFEENLKNERYAANNAKQQVLQLQQQQKSLQQQLTQAKSIKCDSEELNQQKSTQEQLKFKDLELKYQQALQIQNNLESQVKQLQNKLQMLKSIQKQEIQQSNNLITISIDPANKKLCFDAGCQTNIEIESESENRQNRIDKLELQIKRLQEETRDQSESHQSELTKLNTQIGDLTKANQELEKEQVAFDIRCHELEQENKQLAATIVQKDANQEIINLEHDQMQSQMHEYQQNEKKLLQDLQEAQMKLNSKFALGLDNKPICLTKSIQTSENDDKVLMDQLNEIIEQKDQQLKQMERKLLDQDIRCNQIQKENEDHFIKEAKILQDTATEELKRRADEIELVRSQLENEIKSLEQAHREQIDLMTHDFEHQLKEMEKNLVQNELQVSLQAQRKQSDDRIEAIQVQYKEELERVRKGFEDKIKRITADADREARQHREEQDRLRKQAEERVKRIRQENEQAIKRAEFTAQEALTATQQKAKKDIKIAQEKGKSDLKNAVDDVKNDMARAKADWERERKKIQQDFEIKFQEQKNEQEDIRDQKIRHAKEQSDKVFKQRLQEKEELWQSKFEEIEAEIEGSLEEHRMELRNERERHKLELEQLEASYHCQIDSLTSQLTKTATTAQITHPHNLNQAHTSQKHTQTDQQYNTSPTKKDALKLNEQQMQIMHQEIQQIKLQYNQKLQKEIDSFKSNQEGLHNQTEISGIQISHFSKILRLEFEKILLSLKMKSQNMRQDQLDVNRNEINKAIQKIIQLDKSNLKSYVEEIKIKISEVLTLFKKSLEEKQAKKIKDLEQEKDQLQKQLKDLTNQSHQNTATAKQNAPQIDNQINQAQIQTSLQKKQATNELNSYNNKSADSEDFGILQKLEPQIVNDKGKIIVEVEKAYQDFVLFYKALIAGRFFKLCLPTNSKCSDFPGEEFFDEAVSQQQIVKYYRNLQNTTFKLIAKLNQGAENLERGPNEIYRLKLLNQQTRQENQKLVDAISEQDLNQKEVRHLLDEISEDQQLLNMLSEQSYSLLIKVQELQPSLEQLLRHQKILIGLFTLRDQTGGLPGSNIKINRNCAEINQNCQRYLEETDFYNGPQFSQTEANQKYAQIESQFDAQSNNQKPDLFYHHNPANMGDFTIQNSFSDQQTIHDDQSNLHTANQTIQKPNNSGQGLNNQSSGNMLNLDTISQDQAVNLLAKVFSKLNLGPQTQKSSDLNKQNNQESGGLHQNWYSINAQNNTEDYIVMNATGPSSSLLAGQNRGHQNFGNVYASQQYPRSANQISNVQPIMQPTVMQPQHQSPLNATTNNSQIDLPGRLATLGQTNLTQSLDQSNLMDHTLQSAMTTLAATGYSKPDKPHTSQVPGEFQALLPQSVNSQAPHYKIHVGATGTAQRSASKTEDCIQQAESLLRMFKDQAGSNNHPNQGQYQTDQNLPNETGEHAYGQTAGPKLMHSINMPLQKTQKSVRINNTSQRGALAHTSNGTDQQTIGSQQYSKSHREVNPSISAIRKFSQNRYGSLNNQNSINDQVHKDQIALQNFRSIDYSNQAQGKLDMTQATQVSRGQRVPPLELNFTSDQQLDPNRTSISHSEYTAGLKQTPAILSQTRQPSENRDPARALPSLNTADEYFKYHKKLRNNKSFQKEERRQSSQVQLQRIEGVVSPISSHKQRDQGADFQQFKPPNKYQSIQSAQMELKPASSQIQMKRSNSVSQSQNFKQRSGSQQQFQTVEVYRASNRYQMIKKGNTLRPNLPRHANQKSNRRDQPREVGSNIIASDNSAGFDNHRTFNIHNQIEDYVDTSQEFISRPERYINEQPIHHGQTNIPSFQDFNNSDLPSSGQFKDDNKTTHLHTNYSRSSSKQHPQTQHFQTIPSEATNSKFQRVLKGHPDEGDQRNTLQWDKEHKMRHSSHSMEQSDRASQKETIHRHDDQHNRDDNGYKQDIQRPDRYGQADNQDVNFDQNSPGHRQTLQAKQFTGMPSRTLDDEPSKNWHSSNQSAGLKQKSDRYRRELSRGADPDDTQIQSGYMQARNTQAQINHKPAKQLRKIRRVTSSSDEDDF